MHESRRERPLRFDPFSLADVSDPYPSFAELRDGGPLCRGSRRRSNAARVEPAWT